MATYTRIGTYLLASELASDAFGSIHRAVVPTGASFDRHVLVRTFSEEFYNAGMGTKAAEVNRVLPLLGGSKSYGTNYRYEGGKTPHVACDYIPGRSLGQMIEKAKHEQIPFGIDHALSVVQGIAQSIVQLHGKGVHHGVLSPASVWVSFEGATHLIDAPYASVMQGYLAKAPIAQGRLAPYLQGQGMNPLQQDFFALGVILYELLTFDRFPVGLDNNAVLNKAMLKASQEEGPIPAEIKGFMARLLTGQQPFSTIEGFNAELERVLYDGDYSPTTFNMAFFMHTLFREENDRDQQAMKAEQSDSYLAYTATGDELRSGAHRAQHIDHAEGEEESKGLKKGLFIGGGVAAAAIVAAGYFALKPKQLDPEMQRQLAQFQQEKMRLEQEKADLEQKQKMEQQRSEQIKKELQDTKNVEQRAKLEEELKKQQEKQKELERKQQQISEQKKAQEDRATRLAVKQPELVKPQPEQPKPQPEQPKPQPPPEQPKPQPVQPPPVQPQPEQPKPQPTTPSIPDTPAALVSGASLALPQRAVALNAANQERRVTLRVFVDEQGSPLRANVVSGVPGGYGYDEAATDAAMRSSYRPATREGRPSRGSVDVTFRFPKKSGR
jgi:TonB family protein